MTVTVMSQKVASSSLLRQPLPEVVFLFCDNASNNYLEMILSTSLNNSFFPALLIILKSDWLIIKSTS